VSKSVVPGRPLTAGQQCGTHQALEHDQAASGVALRSTADAGIVAVTSVYLELRFVMKFG
jgi:hypothetical protein